MANMSFGVNILPKSNNTYTLGNSDYKWNIFVNTINGTALSNIILPAVTSTDNGKILGVSNGAWTVITAPTTDISTKADKTNTILISSLTMGTRQEGYATGTNSVAMGTNNRATATSSFVNGENSLSTGPAATSMGYYCEATNYGSNALGVSAKAYGFAAHADGNDTQAYGDYSSVSGRGTLLYGRASHIFGEYNIDSNGSSTAAGDRGTYVEIVGNGTSGSARSNARMLTWAGTEYLGGDLYVNCGSDGTNGSKVATETYVTTAIGNISIPTNVSDLTNDAGYLTAHQDISGLAPKASPIFTESISLGRKDNTTVGGNSYAVGTNVEASADNAHAEGNSTRAAYVDSHAEGWGSEAISQAAHAEGRQGRATAFSAHAEGCQTTASGYASHSQGMGTQAKNKSQHVAGEYNVLDPSTNAAGWRGEYAEIIGNGTDNNNRSNARVLDWSGNERLKGDLYVGCNADSTGGVKVATKDYVDNAFSSEENTIDIDKTISTPAAIQTIEDGADGLPVGMEIGIEPVQDLHGYENPWPAGGMGNLFPSPESGSYGSGSNIVTIRRNADLSFSLTKTGTNWVRVPIGVIKLPAGTYTIIEEQTGTPNIDDGLSLYTNPDATADYSTRYNKRIVFTISEEKQYYCYYNIATTSPNTTIKAMLFTGDTKTASDYVPYSNVCPISGWTGANVTWCGKNLYGGTKSSSSYISIIYGGRDCAHIVFDEDYSFKPGTYRCSFDIEGTVVPSMFVATKVNGVWLSPQNKGQIKTFTFTVPENCEHLEIWGYDGTYTGFKNVQIELGSAPATDYEPPYMQNIDITFPSSAGTVYGGTLTVNQDGTGTLVVDRFEHTFTGNESFATNVAWGQYSFLYDTGTQIKSSYTTKTSCKSSHFTVCDGGSWTNLAPNQFMVASSTYIGLGYDGTKEELKAWLAAQLSGNTPVQVMCMLNASTEYELTALEVIEMLQGTNNIWADTGDINSLTYSKQTSGLINTQDKVKINSLSTVALSGSYTDLLNKPDLSQYLTSVPTMIGATSSANGTAGLIPAPTSADAEKFFRGDGTWQDGGRPMVILSYGNSTWNDFITAYNNNVIVYCRASSNSNPATGSQTRMAFMAYVNNATKPTEVEFQYYRSMSSHSATAMGDEVYVYKLTNAGVWSVTVRPASVKEIKMNTNSAGSVSWSSNVVTLNSGLPKVSASDNGKILMVVNGEWAAVTPST